MDKKLCSVSVFKMVVVFAVMLVVAGCDPEGDEQRTSIGRTLLVFKEAVNSGSRVSLNAVVSSAYRYDGLNKEAFVERTLARAVTINGSSIQKIDLNEAKDTALVRAEWRNAGEPVLVRVPIFQREVTVNTTVHTTVRFLLAKEDAGVWRILEAEQLVKSWIGTFGPTPPRITLCDIMPETPRRSEAVEVRMRVARNVEEEGVFLVVNGVPLGSYTQSGLPENDLNDTFLQVFRVPDGLPEGRPYSIEVLASEGKIDPIRLELSELTGLEYRKLELPVR